LAEVRAGGKKSLVLRIGEDERQIPCYHLNSPAVHAASLFKYGGKARLYSITVMGEPIHTY